MSLVDVVVPVRDRWDLTRRCLEHLEAQSIEHTVIVCDNGSTDDTPRRIRLAFPEARVEELHKNAGFPAACNHGVRSGMAAFVVLLNNDVDLPPPFLERLLAPLQQDHRVGSVAALLVVPAGTTIDSFGLAVDPTLAGFPRLRGRPVAEAQTIDPVLAGPTGAAGAYRRHAWNEVGGLDEGVLAYSEDVDLALRLRAAGWSTAGVADAVATHVGSASAGVRSAWQRYQGGFSRAHFLRRYGVLRTRAGPRAAVTETLAALGDALVYSHDLAATRGRIAGWRAAAGKPRNPWPPEEAVDEGITFLESLRRREEVYASTSD